MRESDLEDAHEAAAADAKLTPPRRILAAIKEDLVDILCEIPSRRARFTHVEDVEVHIFDAESEDEQSLEDYFGNWSELDKATILSGMSILEVDVSPSSVDHLAYTDPNSLGS
jgi:hypothetical protein